MQPGATWIENSTLGREDVLRLAQLAIEAGLARHVLVPYAIRSTKPGGVYGFHAREPQKAGLDERGGG